MLCDSQTMITRILRLFVALFSLAATTVFFVGFGKIASDYGWSFTAPINFGVVNEAEVIGPLWIPLVICLLLGLGFLVLAGKQLVKVFPKSVLKQPGQKVF